MIQILVIEDIQSLREGIAEKLRLNGYGVYLAEDGLEGLQLAREHLPDLIISDIMMPEMDGYEVLQELRSDSMTATIPFIFLTAKSGHPEVRAGMELGADDYLTKPFREHELLAAIKIRLDKRTLLDAQQLRALTRKSLHRRDEEYRTLAHQIHNDITQPLAGLKLSLHSMKRLSHDALDTKITELQQQVDQLHIRINTTTNELWPLILDDLGLLSALLQLFEQFYTYTQIKVHFKHNHLDSTISYDMKITLYRVIEEALLNVEQHAEVSDVYIAAWIEDNILQFDIEDKGIGFDLESVATQNTKSGLIEIRERVATLGGDIKILSEVGTGVRILGAIPILEHLNEDNPTMKSSSSTNFLSDNQLKPTRSHSAQSNKLQIFIVEDNHIIREGLKRLLEEVEEFQVIGEADQRDDLLRIVWDMKPDLLILGMMLSGYSTLDLIQPIREILPRLHILVFSGHTNKMYSYEASKRGASGYVLNNIEASELIEIVRQIGDGQTYWSPFSDGNIDQHTLETSDTLDDKLTKYSNLTSREREILPLVAEGHTSKEIATILSISPRTVETHRSNIASKLGLRKQSELIHYAIKHGLILDS